MHSLEQDRIEIEDIISKQFKALCWTEDISPDFKSFTAAFIQSAHLFSSKRPAHPQSASEFARRMENLRDNHCLKNFSERGRGLQIFIVGNIAMAMAGCEMTENKDTVTKDISMFLLVKENKKWRIASQAWDIVEDIGKQFSMNNLPLARKN